MSQEETAGGVVGRIAGKAKEVAGSATGNEEMAREGRLQQASVDQERVAAKEAAEARQREAEAELEAERDETQHERERLLAEQAEKERADAIERDRVRAEQQAAAEQARAEQAAATQRQAAERAAQTEQERAQIDRAEDAADAVTLAREAREAEARADALDPETKP
jgi:uncharacterized protein YjbJ (UPF0337 family)